MRFSVADLDHAHRALGLETLQIDCEEPVRKICGLYLDSIGKHECAAELTGSDATVKKFARFVLLLLAAHRELAVLQRNLQLIARETGDRKRDAQQLTRSVVSFDALDVVWGITIAAALRGAVDQTFNLVEPQQQGISKAATSATCDESPFQKRPSLLRQILKAASARPAPVSGAETLPLDMAMPACDLSTHPVWAGRSVELCAGLFR